MVSAEQIKQQIQMTDLLERLQIEPSRSGFIHCPAHTDDTASLKIYDSDKGFYCFSCSAGGSVIDFATLYFKVDFRQAIKELSHMFGLHGGELTAREKQAIYERQQKHEQQKRKQQEYETAWKQWREANDNMRNHGKTGWTDELETAILEFSKADRVLEGLDER